MKMLKHLLLLVVAFTLTKLARLFINGLVRYRVKSMFQAKCKSSANMDCDDNATSTFSRPASTADPQSLLKFSSVPVKTEVSAFLGFKDKFAELRKATPGNTFFMPRQLDPLSYVFKLIGNYGTLDGSFKRIYLVARFISLLLTPKEGGAYPSLDRETIFFTTLDILYNLEEEKTYGKFLFDWLCGDGKAEFQERAILIRSKISCTYLLHQREVILIDLLIERIERIILLHKLAMLDKDIANKANFLNEQLHSENNEALVKHTIHASIQKVFFFLLSTRSSAMSLFAPRNVTYEEILNNQQFINLSPYLIDICESYLAFVRECRGMYSTTSPPSISTNDLLSEWFVNVINSSFEEPIASAAFDWFNFTSYDKKPANEIKELEIENIIRFPRMAASRFLFSTIDTIHRHDYGIEINAEQAKTLKYKVANEVLNFNELSTTDYAIEIYSGAVICRGAAWKYPNNGTQTTNIISKELQSLNLTGCISFVVMNNQLEFHRFVRSFPQLAPDTQATVILLAKKLLPVVIFYPKQWELAVRRDAKRPWEKLVHTASTGVAPINAINFCLFRSIIDNNDLLAFNNVKQMLIMITASLLLMFIPPKIEQLVARKYGVEMQPTLIPSTFGLLHVGYKSTLLDLTANKQVLFDITVAGVGSGLLMSILCLTTGLFLTSTASPETITSLPEMPERLSSLSFFTQYVSSWVVSNSNQPVLMNFGDVTGESHNHMHGLAIIGAMSYIGYALQLYPANNGHLYKIINAFTKGAATPAMIAAATNFILFFLVVAANLLPNNLPLLLVLELATKNWIKSGNDDCQLVEDGLTPIDEGRKMIALLLAGMFFTSIL